MNSQKNNNEGTLSNEAISKITSSNQSILKALNDIGNLIIENQNNMPENIILESQLVVGEQKLAKVIVPYLAKEQMRYEKNNLK